MAIRKIVVEIEVNEEVLKKERDDYADRYNFESAVNAEFNWLHDSGMSVLTWKEVTEE